MYEKLTKCPHFTRFLPENTLILHNNCQKKIFFPYFFWLGGKHVPPCLPVSYACGYSAMERPGVELGISRLTYQRNELRGILVGLLGTFLNLNVKLHNFTPFI